MMRWRTDRCQQLCLSVGLVIVAWWIVVRGVFDPNTSFYISDSVLIDVPRRVYAAKELLSGHFPDWTFRLGCGFPLLAEGQTAFLYPPSLLYWLSPTPEANDWFITLHMLLLAVFLWLFLARFAGALPAVSGAVALLAGAYIQTNHMIPGTVATLCWMPLSLWGMDRWCAGHRASIAWSSLATAMAILAWEPHTMAAVFVIQGLFIVYRSFIDPIEHTRESPWTWSRGISISLRLGTYGVLVGILLTAFQVVPCIDYVIETSRVSGIRSTLTVEQFRLMRVPPFMLLTLLHPDFWGTPWSPGQDYFWEEHLTLFLGFVPLVLAPIGMIWSKSNPSKWFWIAMMLLGLDFVMSGPVHRMLYFTPIFGWFRWPGHYMALFALPVTWFTAMGAKVVSDQLAKVGLSPFITGSLLAILSALGHVRTVGDFIAPVDIYDSAAPEIVQLAQSDPNFRTLPVVHPLFGQNIRRPLDFRATLASGMPDFNLKDRIPTAVQCNQLETVSQREITELLRVRHANPLRMMAITHFTSPDSFEQWPVGQPTIDHPYWTPPREDLEQIPCERCFLYRYRRSLPRVRMLYDAHVEPDRKRRLEWIQSDQFDPETTAIVETPIDVGARPASAPSLTFHDVTDSTMSIQVTTDSQGMLVVADTFSAHVVGLLDGERVDVHRVNHAFRGIVVPPGTHTVLLTYRNRWFPIGIVLTAFGMNLLVLLARLPATYPSHNRFDAG